MMFRQAFRRLSMGLATLTGIARRGFFTPYRYAGSVPETVEIYGEIASMMQAAEPAIAKILDNIEQNADALRAIGDAPAPQPRWNQSWFPRLDAAAAYTIVREIKPARIVEIGSGHSTRFMARAIADGGISCKQIAIDPAPRAVLRGLAVEWVPDLLSITHFPLFDALGDGDLLIIDSSHILWPGSDVDMLFSRVLPRLAPGVLVHIHDIFLPDGYPAGWLWRGYTEQQGVAALLAGGGFDIVFSSHYAKTRMNALVAAPLLDGLGCPAEAFETSLWLRKAKGTNAWR